jgi:hyperosmotically inducible periplasmic protein
MKLVTTIAALGLLALGTAACDRPTTQTTASNGGTASTTPSPSTSTATPDAASPNAPATASMAPGPAGDASGAVSETVTTGKIKAAIASDAGLRDSDISVTTEKGVVTLSGTAKSQDQVSMATALAQRQDGVVRVENNISVQ